jgi:hypothetical protein
VPEAFDVVIVPDFRPEAKADFEIRTLLFLASWTENAGLARDFPLHVACIGTPPESVRALAARAGASVTAHQPFDPERGWRTPNKLRGLEVRRKEKTVLLLDVDVIVLGDLAPLGDFGECIAATPAIGPRVSVAVWRRIYDRLGMEMPEKRIASVRGELDCPFTSRFSYPGRGADLLGMPPLYAGGAIYFPWGSGLPEFWAEHVRKIAGLFAPSDPSWRSIACSDQTGLSTAVQLLREQGVPFRPLPACYHATWLHLFRRAVPIREIRLFHAFRFARRTPSWAGCRNQVRTYRTLLALGMCKEAVRQDMVRLRLARAARDLPGAIADANAIGATIERLYARHVGPLLGGPPE